MSNGRTASAQLMDTLQGFCNESTCTRVEILGALEGVKLALYLSWNKDDDEDDDE